MPARQRLALVLKYSCAERAAQLAAALRAWEACACAVRSREEVLERISLFEREASDPRRLFGSAAVAAVDTTRVGRAARVGGAGRAGCRRPSTPAADRLQEERKRKKLLYELKKSTAHCTQLLRVSGLPV
jgi:hypothetical protein